MNITYLKKAGVVANLILLYQLFSGIWVDLNDPHAGIG